MVDILEPALLTELDAVTRQIAGDAARLLVAQQSRERTITYKDRRRADPVTDADTAAEGLLRETIQHHFPEHGILGEEGVESETGAGAFVWAIDPLDGTANYAAGLPFFAVSVAVLHQGRPIVGSIAVPSLGLLYHAAVGRGAFVNDTPLTAASGSTIERGAPVGLFAGWRFAFAPRRRLRHRYGEPRALGSIAAELGLVAAGALQYAAYAGPKVWDVAAGAVLTREAGGLVYAWDRRAGWQPLDRFTPVDARRGLRGWSAPVLAGGAAIVPLVARDLVPRRPRAAWRLLKRLLAARSTAGDSTQPPTAPTDT